MKPHEDYRNPCPSERGGVNDIPEHIVERVARAIMNAGPVPDDAETVEDLATDLARAAIKALGGELVWAGASGIVYRQNIPGTRPALLIPLGEEGDDG